MTSDQAIDAGCAFALAHLKVIEAAYGIETAAAYAAGHAWAAGRYVQRTCGDEAAYTLCQNLADKHSEPMLKSDAA